MNTSGKIKHSIQNELRQDIRRIMRSKELEKDIPFLWSFLPKEFEEYAKYKGLALGIDPVVPATLALAAFSAAWMPHFLWEFYDERPMPLSFNFMLIAPSSYGKSACAAPFFSIFSEKQAEEAEVFQQAKVNFSASRALIYRKIDQVSASKLDEVDKNVLLEKLNKLVYSLATPKQRKYKIEDVNVASFCDAMRQNGRSAMTWYSEEASSIFMSSEFKRNTSVFCRNFIAMMSNGELHFERTTVEKEQIVNVAINAVFLIQNELLKEFFSGQIKIILQSGGFFNRFVIIRGEKRGDADKFFKRQAREAENRLCHRLKSLLEMKERHELVHRIIPGTIDKSAPENTNLEKCDGLALKRRKLLFSEKATELMEKRTFELINEPLYLKDEEYARKLYIDVGNIASLLFLFDKERENVARIVNNDDCDDNVFVDDVYVERAIELATSYFLYKRLVLNDELREAKDKDEPTDIELFAEICYSKRMLIRDKKVEDCFVIKLTTSELKNAFPTKYHGKNKLNEVLSVCGVLVKAGLLEVYNLEKMRFKLTSLEFFGLK